VANKSRDSKGRWAKAQAAYEGSGSISSGTDPAPRGPGANINRASSDPAGLSTDPAAVVNKSDVWGNLSTQTNALINRPVGGKGGGGGLGGKGGGATIEKPDFGAGFRALGLSGEGTGIDLPEADYGEEGSESGPGGGPPRWRRTKAI
jgi:hypothetical protein